MLEIRMTEEFVWYTTQGAKQTIKFVRHSNKTCPTRTYFS